MPANSLLAGELLVEARRRVERGWCQRTLARDADGRSVLPSDPAATCWSAVGAIIGAADAAVASDDSRRERFALAMHAFSSVVDAGPQTWNDRPDRSAPEVVGALTDALRLLRA
jgi:hypothetical protein